jgi:hypothetical protein
MTRGALLDPLARGEPTVPAEIVDSSVEAGVA